MKLEANEALKNKVGLQYRTHAGHAGAGYVWFDVAGYIVEQNDAKLHYGRHGDAHDRQRSRQFPAHNRHGGK